MGILSTLFGTDEKDNSDGCSGHHWGDWQDELLFTQQVHLADVFDGVHSSVYRDNDMDNEKITFYGVKEIDE